MSLFDLFKPKIKHSDPHEKKDAIKGIRNSSELVTIILNDSSDDVKLEAIKNLNDISAYKKILLKKTGLPSENIINHLFTEMDKKGLKEKFFVESSDSPVLHKYIEYINNNKKTSLLEEICRKTDNPAVIIPIIEKIDDIDFLQELKDKKNSKKIGRAIKKKIASIRPDFLEFKVQRDCPECGHPIMVNGPVINIECSTCSSTVNIGEKYWKDFFKRSKTSGVFIMGRRIGDKPGTPGNPRCHKCKEKLNVKDAADESSGQIKCKYCGTLHNSYPAPKWMKKFRNINNKSAKHVFCAISEGQESEEPVLETKPIAFNCINCSGSLQFDKDTPRIMDCQYCGTQQYLPASLWHALHPVNRIRPWYVLFK